MTAVVRRSTFGVVRKCLTCGEPQVGHLRTLRATETVTDIKQFAGASRLRMSRRIFLFWGIVGVL